MNIGILASGKGSNFEALVKAFREENRVLVKCLVSDQPGANVNTLADQYGIKKLLVSFDKDRTKLDDETKIADYLIAQGVEWVVLAGYMRILKKPMLSRFPNRILNIHPSLLPSFPGLNAVKQALDYGVKFTGCTVHYVNENIDQGKIIAQKVVPVLEEDTLDSLLLRVHQAEHALYPQVIRDLIKSEKHSSLCQKH